jgi:hypothetical protein
VTAFDDTLAALVDDIRSAVGPDWQVNDDGSFVYAGTGCAGCARYDLRQRDAVLGFEAFTYEFPRGDAVSWDVDRARKLVAARPRAPIALPEEFCRAATTWGALEIFPEHYDHVALDVPGLVVMTPSMGADAGILIDGRHRAGRALKEGVPFFAYVLTGREELRVRIMRR